MVAKFTIVAGVALGLLGPLPAWAQSDAVLNLTDKEFAATNEAMIGAARPQAIQGKAAVRSSKPMIAAPRTAEFTELLVSYSDKRSRTKFELGALGGGRADAPGLVHVGLGMNF